MVPLPPTATGCPEGDTRVEGGRKEVRSYLSIHFVCSPSLLVVSPQKRSSRPRHAGRHTRNAPIVRTANSAHNSIGRLPRSSAFQRLTLYKRHATLLLSTCTVSYFLTGARHRDAGPKCFPPVPTDDRDSSPTSPKSHRTSPARSQLLPAYRTSPEVILKGSLGDEGVYCGC